MKSIITTKQRRAMKAVEDEKCGAKYNGVLMIRCMLPKGHRGRHASERTTVHGGRISALWPR